MSRFGRLFRATAAALTVTAAPAGAEEPAPLPDVNEFLNQNPISPAGFGRGARTPAPPACNPCCPPGGYYTGPFAPSMMPPTAMPPTGQPPVPPGMGMQPPTPQAANTGEAPDFGGRERGAGAGPTVGLHGSPNMFGDQLGSRPSQIVVLQSIPGALNGQNLTIRLLTGPPPSSFPGTVTTLPGQTVSAVLPGVYNQTLGAADVLRQTVTGLNQPVALGSPQAQQLAGALQYITQPAGTFTNPPPGFGLNQPIQAGAGSLTDAIRAFESQNPNAVFDRFSLGGLQALYNGSELLFLSQVSSQLRTPVMIGVPNPSSGGVVGIIKFSEDNNPLPRDRVIFNYDYFDNVPLAPGGIPLNRFQFGLEKAFFNGRMSVEARVPFANTLSSNVVLGGSTRGTEFGNVVLTTKVLMLRGNVVNVSGGLAVALPTADDVSIRTLDGTQMIDIKNKAVQLSPFLAMLYTPNDRLFAQAWYGFRFNSGGNTVRLNSPFFGGTADVGSLRAAPLMLADLQLGYWVYRANQGLLRGVAPFGELHYTTDVGRGTLLRTGNGFLIGDLQSYDELNITGGITTMLGQNATLAVGGAAPLLGQSHRTFDWQFGVRFNYYFGYTARQRGAAMAAASTFSP